MQIYTVLWKKDYDAVLLEVDQVLVSHLQCSFGFVVFSGCNLSVAALPKKPLFIHRDHMCPVQHHLLSLHTPWNNQGRARKEQEELGLEWNWNSITHLL